MKTRSPYKPLFPHNTTNYIGLCTEPGIFNNDLIVELYEDRVELVVKAHFEHIFDHNCKAQTVSRYNDKYTKACEFSSLNEVQDYLKSRDYIICSDNVQLHALHADMSCAE
jgi:CTP:phosphocholine cytidylyltransferase-like protein